MNAAQIIAKATRDSHVTTEEVVAEMLAMALELEEDGKHGQAEVVREAVSKIEAQS